MSPTADPQTTIYETTVEDEALEAALEHRQTLKEQAADARRKYKEADDVTKSKIEMLDLGQDAPARVGRFVLTRKATKARTVNFETAAGSRVTIGLLPDE